MEHQVFTFDELCKAAGYDDLTGDAVLMAREMEMMKHDPIFKSISTTLSGPLSNIERTSPLMLENLDGLMTEVLINEGHFKLFNAIGRVPSPGPYYEWNRHKGFGSRRGGIGFAEGGAPKGSISAFERKGIYNKYLGAQGGITHQMLTAGNNGGTVQDPNTIETRDRTMELFERMEREIIFGDKSIKNESGVEVMFDGLLTQLNTQLSANVVDMAGQPLTFANLDDAARSLVKQGKQMTVSGYTGYGSVEVIDGLNAQYKDRNIFRHNKDAAASAAYTPGFELPAYQTQFGSFKFEHSILLSEIEDDAPVSGTAIAGAPSAPTVGTGSAQAGGSLPNASATYDYVAAAFNDTGESLPAGTKVSVAITAASGNYTARFTITRTDASTTGYRIYRKLSTATTYEWIARVACSGASQTFDDTNAWRTSTNGAKDNGMMVLIKPDPRDLTIAQMCPLTKMPLPQAGTTYPFLLLLYCVLVLKAPERVMIFKNCGKYTPV